MRRSIPAVLVVVVGLVLLVDYVLINPTLAGLASGLFTDRAPGRCRRLAGAATLVLRHWTDLAERRRDPLGSGVLLGGFAIMVLAGFYPGSTGASDPAVRWLVAALLAPLIASCSRCCSSSCCSRRARVWLSARARPRSCSVPPRW